jgi:outer membrane cobalamin receptor
VVSKSRPRRLSITWAAALAGAAFGACTWAQERPLRELSPVVVSASRLPLTEATVSQHVSVYTREQIEQETPASVAEFLSRRAGVAIDRSARSGGYGSLFLRGADPSHVVVLIDGIRQNDPLSSRGSAVDLNTLTLDDVERIEVVRGSASVASAEALAGVVQIFTRPPGNKARGRASLEAGGQGLRAASASISRGSWNASVAQRADGTDDTGHSRTRAANIGFRDKWGGTALHAQLRLADSHNTGFPDDSGGPRYAVNRQLESRDSNSQQLALGLEHELGAGSRLELLLARFQRDSDQDTPQVAPGMRDPFGLPRLVSDSRYRRNEAQVNWRWNGAPGWDVLVGAGSQVETGALDSRIFLRAPVPANFSIRRVTHSLAAEVRKITGPWSVQFGLRHEQTPGQESIQHPAFSLQYQPREDSGRIGATFSSAGKLPSFFALGHPLVGNPQLKPERSRQAELFYATPESAPWKARVTLFDAHYRDLVDFDSGPPPGLVNRAAIRSTGVELNASHQWQRDVLTYAHATLMRVRDPDGGPPLRSRPQRQAGIGIETGIAPQWRMQAELSHVGRRFDSSIPTGDAWLGAYARLDLSVTWRGRHWQAFGAVDNVLNHEAEETIGTPVGQRRLRIGLRWEL